MNGPFTPVPDERVPLPLSERKMPRPTSIYSPDSPSSPRFEPDIGARALLKEPLRTGPGSDDPEVGGPNGFLSPTAKGDKFATGQRPSYMMVIVAPVIIQMLGVGGAYAIFTYAGKTDFAVKMAQITAAGLHWIYAAAGLLAFTVRFVNFFPMASKSLVMSGALRSDVGINVRSNPFIYQVVGKQTPVVFDNEGWAGAYNRANRSLHHMIENISAVLVNLILAGYVFPFPTFVCIGVFCLGRIVHQVGYTSGYGGHGTGFALATLSSTTLEGLSILVALYGTGLVI